MKIAFCWPTISGYMSACWKALHERAEVNLFVMAYLPAGNEPEYNPSDLLGHVPNRLLREDERFDINLIRNKLAEVQPDALFIPGWMNPVYVKLALSKQLARIPIIMTMDNPRKPGSVRQALARLKLRRVLNRIDGAFVTGERCWQLARHLNLPEQKIWRGAYGVDVRNLAPLLEKRKSRHQGWPKRFLYLGQFYGRKGIRTLSEAYRLYRETVEKPWPLRTCGSGPLREQFRNVEGVEECGFVQPAEVLEHMIESGVLVHPSHRDAWPLAIVEGCAAGLPVVCSEACGSSVELIRPFHNGLTAPTKDPISLANRLIWMHTNHNQLEQMGTRSAQLGSAYSAERWADRVLGILSDVEAQRSGRLMPASSGSAEHES